MSSTQCSETRLAVRTDHVVDGDGALGLHQVQDPAVIAMELACPDG